jgi:hypothetical protein
MSKFKFQTPKGTAVWPWFSVPDTRFDTEGKYKTDLLVPKADAAELMAKAKEIFIEEFGEKDLKKAKWPFAVDEESGGVRFRAKSTNKPVLFDGQGQKINEDLKVGNGSVIKLSGQMSTYNAGGSVGVTMYLNAVQIIDLVEFNDAGFAAEEGAYVHESSKPEENTNGAAFDF